MTHLRKPGQENRPQGGCAMNDLILASSSPRRQALLQQVNIVFSTRHPDVDESQITVSDPRKKVEQLAMLKGKSTPLLNDREVILSADTVVSFNKDIFEKPKDADDALRMLFLLSGSIHEVFTGVMLRSSEQEVVFSEKTEVEFWPMSRSEIEAYIATEEPFDKAGAYGIQAMGAMFVKGLRGDYHNVVGLPISRVVRNLKDFSIYPM